MSHLLSIELMGGLGNQLFQIATAYSYACKYGLELILPTDWNTSPQRPPIWKTYFRDSAIPFQLMPRDQFQRTRWYRIAEQGFLYRPIPKPPAEYPFLRLIGYFQSSFYFSDHADEIRNLLSPSPAQVEAAKHSLIEQGVHPSDGWIAAHVRRGDYLNAAAFHVTTTPTYFTSARSHIEKGVGGKRGVVWITEDPDWVYTNCYQQGDKVICNDSIKDFVTLSLFQHVIMSNSSFSWWAVWLNPSDFKNRQICCPSEWFGPSGPKDTETVYEADWNRIDPNSGNCVKQAVSQVSGSSAGH